MIRMVFLNEDKRISMILDAEGLATWLARPNGGFATPDQLLGEFENSAEFKAVDKAMKN